MSKNMSKESGRAGLTCKFKVRLHVSGRLKKELNITRTACGHSSTEMLERIFEEAEVYRVI